MTSPSSSKIPSPSRRPSSTPASRLARSTGRPTTTCNYVITIVSADSGCTRSTMTGSSRRTGSAMTVSESSSGRRRSSRAKDGSSTKTVTADEAIIDLNQPLSFNAKPDAEPIVVKHARLERNVMIRDDRGTLNDRTDDLLIGPLTWVEFDDDKLQLNSDSDVLIVDRDTRITGAGMLIRLRPKSESGLPARTLPVSREPRAHRSTRMSTSFSPTSARRESCRTRRRPSARSQERSRSGSIPSELRRMARPRTRQALSPCRWTSVARVRCRSLSPSRTCRSRRARRCHRVPRWCTSNAT